MACALLLLLSFLQEKQSDFAKRWYCGEALSATKHYADFDGLDIRENEKEG